MKISVALCTYNGEKFILEQLNSIINQTLKVDEIIICDDRSTDSTLQIIEKLSKKHNNLFKTYINEKKLGSVKNFEKAIEISSGDVIFLSDQDDKWHPEKVASFIASFEKNPTIEVLASNGYLMDNNSQLIDNYTIWDILQFLKDENISYNYYDLITCIGNFATGASMAFKKEFKTKCLPFPQIKDFHHDEWIATIAAKDNTFELLNDKYFYYRIHQNQQVGGVNYLKDDKVKKSLIEKYNIWNDDSFMGLKHKLKRVQINYYKNIAFLNQTTTHKAFFEANTKHTMDAFIKLKAKLKTNFPKRYLLLKITDTVLKKDRHIYIQKNES